jgi:actin-related protein
VRVKQVEPCCIVPLPYTPCLQGHSAQRLFLFGTQIGGARKEYFVGDEMQRKRGMLKLSYPVLKGVVQNWDDMEKIW